MANQKQKAQRRKIEIRVSTGSGPGNWQTRTLNDISGLGVLHKLTNLMMLDLSHNQPATLPEAITKLTGLKEHLDLMKEVTSKLSGELELSDPSRVRQGMLSDGERSGILALHALLRELDPHHEKLGLRRMPTYTGDYLWLCQTHYAQMQPKIPEKI